MITTAYVGNVIHFVCWGAPVAKCSGYIAEGQRKLGLTFPSSLCFSLKGLSHEMDLAFHDMYDSSGLK
jgi:hypothetical protein